MKTKHFIFTLLLFLIAQQAILAQSLNSKIKKSVVKIGNSFTEIPKERLLVLDQVAFTLFKRIDTKKNKINIVLLDQENQMTSQLAMIWLKTGLIYYGHQEIFNIQSASINIQSNLKSELNSLKKFGFKIKNNSSEFITIKYGSGSWDILCKVFESLDVNEQTSIIVVDADVVKDENYMGLTFSNTEYIAREMLYIATRINNLLELKK